VGEGAVDADRQYIGGVPLPYRLGHLVGYHPAGIFQHPAILGGYSSSTKVMYPSGASE
jgi:hypothetical protein